MVSRNKLCLALVAAASLSSTGHTQEADGSEVFRLEEIIVTARLREEALQSTPLSITALSGETLEERNITMRDCLAGMVGLSLTS